MLQQYLKQAQNAYNGVSFDPEKRGKNLIDSYSEVLESDLLNFTDEATKEQYKERFIKHFLNYVSAKSRTLSPMITGPARFPVERNRKAMDTEIKRGQELEQFRESFLKNYNKRTEAVKPQDQKDLEYFEKVKKSLTETAQFMHSIDSGENKGFTRTAFGNAFKKIGETIAKKGNKKLSKMYFDLCIELNEKFGTIRPLFSSKNFIYKIEEETEKHREQEADNQARENKIINFEGGEIILNYAIDRIQIKHEEKPEAEVITLLKQNAFKWSPSQAVWQRQLTNNGIWAASRITGVQL